MFYQRGAKEKGLIMQTEKGKIVVQIEQKSKDKIDGNEVTKVVLKYTFNLVIQLLPVWFMLLLESVSNIAFDIQDYTSNLLVYVIMSSVTNIAELSGQEGLDVLADGIKYIFSIILCFSLFFYVLVLFREDPYLNVKNIPILLVAIGLCIIVFMAMFCQEIRKVNEKECRQ